MRGNHLLVIMKFGLRSNWRQMSAEGNKFAAEINNFADEIRAIGPNPIRLWIPRIQLLRFFHIMMTAIKDRPTARTGINGSESAPSDSINGPTLPVATPEGISSGVSTTCTTTVSFELLDQATWRYNSKIWLPISRPSTSIVMLPLHPQRSVRFPSSYRL